MSPLQSARIQKLMKDLQFSASVVQIQLTKPVQEHNIDNARKSAECLERQLAELERELWKTST